MSASTIPRWKTELIEKKKAEKWRLEQIPEWKRSLLNRIRSKHELVKEKLLLHTHKYANDDCLVLNEHILKVSENFFIRMELEQKLASPPLSPHKCYQENEQETTNQFSNDLPSCGLVGRLKGKYSFSPNHRVNVVTSPGVGEVLQTPKKARSKSAVDSPNHIRDEFHVSASQHPHLVTVPPQSQPTPQELHVRKTSIDVITPRGFSPAASSATPSFFQKATSPILIKKFSAPVSTKRKTSSSSKLPEITPSSLTQKNSVSLTKVMFQTTKTATNSEPTKCNGNVGSESDLVQETINLNLNLNLSLPNNSQQKTETKKTEDDETKQLKQKPAIPKKKDGLGNTSSLNRLTGLGRSRVNTNQRLADAKADKYNTLPTTEKNSNGILKRNNALNALRLNEAVVNAPCKTDSLPKSKEIENNSKITSDSSISFSLSERTSSAKLIPTATEKKEHYKKTMISQNFPAADCKVVAGSEKAFASPNKDKTLDNTVENKAKSETQKTVLDTMHKEAKSQHKASKTDLNPITYKSDVLDTSRLDKRQENSTRSDKYSIQTSHKPVVTKKTNAENKDVVISSVNSNKVISSTSPPLNSPKEEVKVVETSQKSSQSVPSSPSRAKLSGPGVTSTKGFGGKTFMIDPSKFKKSTPKTSENNPQLSVSDTSAKQTTGKGKRKLRADQIIVVGGYVKLERSSLAQSNKIRRQVRVKFVETTLEIIHQYPSENSLLEEGNATKICEHFHLLPSRRDSELGNYTAKDLLAKKNEDLSDDDDD